MALLLSCGSSIAGSKGFERYGDVAQIAIPAAAAIGSAFVGDWDGLVQLGASGAATVGVTYALKATVHEQRPDGSDNRSFPSSHASYAFAGSSYLLFRYGWQVGIPAELAASAVAWSRVNARKHFWHDVVASAAIAHVSAFVLVDPRYPNASLTPWADLHKPAFGLTARLAF